MPSTSSSFFGPTRTPRVVRCAVAATGALALTAALTATVQASTAAVPATPLAAADGGERAPGTGTARRPRHASDGEAGWRAEGPRIPARAMQRRSEVGWTMAPGISYRTWESVAPRGKKVPSTVRIHVVTVDLADPTTEFDLLSTKKVAQGSSIGWLTQKAGAVAGVNGDFFDIGDTTAPLGVGKSRKDGLRHGPASGWNSTFWVDKAGHPHIGQVPFTGTIKHRRGNLQVTNYNSPVLPKGGIGIYTGKWGKTSGRTVVNGHKRVRQVMIRKGRVVQNRFGVSSGKKIKGKMLVGQGRSAAKLKRLKKGDKVKLSWRLKGAKPAVAISGDRPLLTDGTRVVINDVLMHPRTAVGIDDDGNKVYLVTVDGRSQVSRGYTMVELADLMTSLGAENALNLDGGGSTTLAGHTAEGVFGILNAPSDGGQRRVPNGLGVFSRPSS